MIGLVWLICTELLIKFVIFSPVLAELLVKLATRDSAPGSHISLGPHVIFVLQHSLDGTFACKAAISINALLKKGYSFFTVMTQAQVWWTLRIGFCWEIFIKHLWKKYQTTVLSVC